MGLRGLTIFLAGALVVLAGLLAWGAWSLGPAAAPLAPGSPLPSFSLPGPGGARLDSRDYAGRPWVLVWLPRPDGPASREEARGFRDLAAAFEDAGLAVAGVAGARPSLLGRVHAEEGLPFPLGSDTGGFLAGELGARRRGLDLPRRLSFLIGADGRILRVYEVEDPAGHAARVLADYRRAFSPAAPASQDS